MTMTPTPRRSFFGGGFLSHSSGVITVAYVAWRVALANRMPLMDCDEVYNYFEPVHYLAYGTGMQTWEYAPEYALRTYAYLLPMVGLDRIYHLFVVGMSPKTANRLIQTLVGYSPEHSSSKFLVFLLLRATLAGLSGCLEVNFCRALSQTTLARRDVAAAVLVLLGSSAGMAHASAAWLPSASIMMLHMYCATCYLQARVKHFVVGAVVATLAIGWPFGVVLFVPMGLHILWLCRNQSLVSLMQWTVVVTVVVQASVMVLDSYFYQSKFVSPILNIFLYNTKGGGDELYGVEPTSYYVKNLLLNFNYTAMLGIVLALPVAMTRRVALRRPWPTHLLVLMSCMYLWLALVMPRPHKEERFLFPMYPVLALSATVACQALWEIIVDVLLSRFGTANEHAPTNPQKDTRQSFQQQNGLLNILKSHGWILLLLPSCGLSILRILALSRYYTAPLRIYASLPPMPTTSSHSTTPRTVCTCGEWYRFPSSYTLPSGYQLGFLPSSFRGQLPRPFGDTSKGRFNDENMLEAERYVTPEDCDFVVSLMDEPESNDRLCALGSFGEWTLLQEVPFLDASRTSTLHRILYLPYLHERAVEGGSVHYVPYALHQRKKQPD